ncbi:MBOAT family O-acyltransferase [Sandaracinus amylolyticus]|uniref:Putative poly(Beta-D-mannuronate) O-acetylase n=1 Tax=Sandaracinus amylolyticus TaxID=927083 RepID=A0A0F6YKS5_9BACT|nr:MBOAT family protein [Sandaracinus amylolyticus]AKF08495.1 Putative poly(beta-D-mannuronate) O-acetylase [Sandaracinus amylolyticus]
MLFNSLDYLLFLALALAGWWVLARAGWVRLLFLIVASCVFYAAWQPWYLGLILGSTLIDWLVAKQIHAHEDDTTRKRWLSVSVVLNLGLLGTFKYFDFGSRAISDALAPIGLYPDPVLLNAILPVGISFYTFESLSYCIDVYRRKTAPAKSPLELLFFITFFPKLVAGPIARPADLLPQLDRAPRVDVARVSNGLFLIATGLVKKVVFADYVSVNLVDRVFDNPDAFTAAEVVIGLYGFTLQIYADFSGYTDVARGSAKLFGIELPENFDRPYQAKSPAEFWRRWHMTLSTWLRDYLYFPLGGSKLGERRTYLNLWLTIFLIGLWHGAAWTFVIYGALQATAVVLHRLTTRVTGKPAGGPDPLWLTALKIAGTMQFVVFSRILFRAESLDNAGEIVSRLGSGTSSLAQIAPGVWLVMLVGFAMHYTPRAWYATMRERFVALPAIAQGALLAVLAGALLELSSTQVVPYIYFQF